MKFLLCFFNIKAIVTEAEAEFNSDFGILPDFPKRAELTKKEVEFCAKRRKIAK